MPRPERSLDPSSNPVHDFAAALRAARREAGDPKYLQMARATGRSKTALSEAAGGDHLATWETVEAYLRACNQDPSTWLPRWEAVRAQVEQGRASKAAGEANGDLPPTDGGTRTSGRRLSRRAVLLAAAALALLTAGALVGVAIADSGARAAVGTVTVVVQNKVASGANGFYEDSTPVYMSTKTEPMCSRNDCEVPDTKMWSGAVLKAICQTQGYDLTNANTQSAGIGQNPNAWTSGRWYKVEMPTGVTGFIAEAYLTPASRGGLGLPQCAD